MMSSIDMGTPEGYTPLMFAAGAGSSRTVGILLDKGANVSVAADGGVTALHFSIQEGHPAITKTLVEAGADIEAKSSDGFSPLHLSAQEGQSEVMQFLIDAGADVDSRRDSQATPLYTAAVKGHVGAVRVLLRANANPRLARPGQSGASLVPLEIAAADGLTHIVRELVQQVGVAACGGPTGGVQALQLAAQKQHMGIVAILTQAGVVDTGRALVCAARAGAQAAVKCLLRQRYGWPLSSGEKPKGDSYADASCPSGATALLYSVGFAGYCSPRLARMLVDVGADTSSAARVVGERGDVVFDDTPLGLARLCLRSKKIEGREATEEQLNRLEAVRRLLMRVEAVHAVSWLWPVDDVAAAARVAEARTRTSRKTVSTTGSPLSRLLPILRRRARRGALMAPLLRRASMSS